MINKLRKFKLAELCSRYGIRQAQKTIADLCDVSQPNVSKWFNADIESSLEIPTKHLRAIASFFNINIEDLYMDHNIEPSEIDTNRQISEKSKYRAREVGEPHTT